MTKNEKHQRPIDLLKRAYQADTVNISIPIDENTAIDAVMSPPDVWQIMEKQDAIYAAKLGEKINQGLGLLPIDEAEWQQEIAQYDKETAERLQIKRPANAAEQQARKYAKFVLIQELLPEIMRDRETNELLFPTAEERKEFAHLIRSNLKLFNMLTQKYIELISKMNQETDAIKKK